MPDLPDLKHHMPQTKGAKSLFDAIESIHLVDPLDLLDRAEEIARAGGSLRVDARHVRQALQEMAGDVLAEYLAKAEALCE